MDAPAFPVKSNRQINPLDEQKWQREISRAQAGEIARITCKAAAYFLNMHEWTLRQLVRNGVGPVPERNQAKPGSTATNQRIYFTLAALEEFKQASQGDTITRGHRMDALNMRKKAAEVEALLEVQAARDHLAKVMARAKRLGVLAFHDLMSACEIQPWALDDEDRILGHAMAVEDEVSDWLLAPLVEVLQEPWVSEEVRQPYHNALAWVLANAKLGLEIARDAQQERDITKRTPEATGARERNDRL